MLEYNKNLDPDDKKNIEFVNVNLLYHELNILLANGFVTCIKKKHILEIEDKVDKLSKIKGQLKKRDYLVTQCSLKKAMLNDENQKFFAYIKFIK